MKCENCKETFFGKNYGVTTGDGKILSYCSPGCKRNGEAKRANLADLSAGTAKGKVFRRDRSGKPRQRRAPLKGAALEKALRPSEGAISKGVEGEFGKYHFWGTRLQSGALKLASGHYMKFCPKGTPDRMFAAGLITFVEVKKPGEKPTDEQISTLQLLQENGALAFIVDDPDEGRFVADAIHARRAQLANIVRLIQTIQKEIDDERKIKFHA